VLAHLHITIHGDVATWLIAAGTFLLATVTGLLALAGWRALGELDEAQTDRRVQVMLEISKRWNSDLLVSAIQREVAFSAEELAEFVDFVRSDESGNPIRERRRLAAERDLVVLLRIPDFFEEIAFMSRFASLKDTELAVFKGLALDEWNVWEPAIQRLRATGDRYSYKQFEELVQRMDSIPDL
jgi:hypothetical protein